MTESKYGKYIVSDLRAPFSKEYNEEYAKFATRVLWMDDKVVDGAFAFVPGRLVVEMQPSLTDGQEYISGPGHVQVGQDITPEHFPVELQGGIEVGSEQMGMMDVVLHFYNLPALEVTFSRSLLNRGAGGQYEISPGPPFLSRKQLHAHK